MTTPTVSTPRVGAASARALPLGASVFFARGRGSGHSGTNGLKRCPACNQPLPRRVAAAGTWHDQAGFPPFATFPPLSGDGASTKGSLALGAVLHQRPAEFGQHPRAIAVSLRGFRRGVAVEAALVDALHDGGEPEQREGDVEVPGGNVLAAGSPRIGRDVLLLGRDAERLEVHAGVAVGRAEALAEVPDHAV